MRRVVLALSLVLTLVGCGFHLAGFGAAVLKNVNVVYEQPYQVLPPPLIDALHARLSSGKGKESARLVIHSIETVQRIAAISPKDGRATAYELVTTVHFDFIVEGKALLQNQALSTRRVYSFDNSRPLAADDRRRELQAAMQRALAELIILRMDTVLDRHPGKLG